MKKICLLTGGYVVGCFALIGLKTCLIYFYDKVGGRNV